MTDRMETEAFIAFALEQLAVRNKHHEFEQICFRCAKARISSNIRVATGPVSTGGDQGRDGETFTTGLPIESGLGPSHLSRRGCDILPTMRDRAQVTVGLNLFGFTVEVADVLQYFGRAGKTAGPFVVVERASGKAFETTDDARNGWQPWLGTLDGNPGQRWIFERSSEREEIVIRSELNGLALDCTGTTRITRRCCSGIPMERPTNGGSCESGLAARFGFSHQQKMAE